MKKKYKSSSELELMVFAFAVRLSTNWTSGDGMNTIIYWIQFHNKINFADILWGKSKNDKL